MEVALAQAEKAELTLLLELLEGGQKFVAADRVVVRPHSMQQVDINMVGAQALQAFFQGPVQSLGPQGTTASGPPGACKRRHFRAQHDGLAPSFNGLPYNCFGSVGDRRIDEVDAVFERLADDRDRLRLAGAGRLTQTAGTAAAQSGNTHFKAGTAEHHSLHRGSSRIVHDAFLSASVKQIQSVFRLSG